MKIMKINWNEMLKDTALSGLKLEIEIIEQKIINAYKLEHYEIIKDLINYKNKLNKLLHLELKEVFYFEQEKKDKEIKELLYISINDPLYSELDYEAKLKKYNELKL